MKDLKYYTPSIEEFHVGFEYEEFDTRWSYQVEIIPENKLKVLEEPKPIKDWHKRTFDRLAYIYPDGEGNIIDYLPHYIENNEIRVKYLDKEDLNEIFYKKETDNHKLKLMQHKTFKETHRIIILNSKTNIPVFEGIIKNKSELKALIKQLGI